MRWPRQLKRGKTESGRRSVFPSKGGRLPIASRVRVRARVCREARMTDSMVSQQRMKQGLSHSKATSSANRSKLSLPQ